MEITMKKEIKNVKILQRLGIKTVVKAHELTPHFPNTTIIPVPKWVVSDNFAGVTY